MVTPASSSHYWSQHQSHPASHGENIEPEQFIIKKPGKFQTQKTTNSYSYRLKYRTESADGSGKGHGHGHGHGNLGNSDGSYNQPVLQFRPVPTNVTKFESNGDELRSKQFKSTSRSSRHGQPQLTSNTPRLPPRPGTVGAYPSKPNVYRNYTSQTPNQHKFVPVLPLATKKWTSSPDSQNQPPGQGSIRKNPTLIPLATRSPFGFITDKLRNRVTQAQRVTYDEQSAHSEFPAVKQDTHFSPLSSSYPPVAPYIFPRSLPTFTDGDLHPSLSILRTCEQISPIPVDLVFRDMKKLRKVGEGVYGEVYLGVFGLSGTTESVYKIVAVEGDKLVNGEKQKRFEEIEPEIVVSTQLNKLRDQPDTNYTTGMAKLHRARVCKGEYPPTFVQAWKQWDKDNRSENELPEFEDNQLYIIFEYEFAGIDAESYKFSSAAQSFALLIQVVHTLAVAESGVNFEHRDLHWGNILIKSTAKMTTKYVINSQECIVHTEGILATIIDFTISRSNGTTDDGGPAFTDLAEDHEQFTGTDDYQFEIYRMMKKANGNEWSGFHPETNIFWTHYLADKLLTKARYADKTSKFHLSNMKRLQRFKDIILRFPSCMEFATNYPKMTV